MNTNTLKTKIKTLRSGSVTNNGFVTSKETSAAIFLNY